MKTVVSSDGGNVCFYSIATVRPFLFLTHNQATSLRSSNLCNQITFQFSFLKYLLWRFYMFLKQLFQTFCGFVSGEVAVAVVIQFSSPPPTESQKNTELSQQFTKKVQIFKMCPFIYFLEKLSNIKLSAFLLNKIHCFTLFNK